MISLECRLLCLFNLVFEMLDEAGNVEKGSFHFSRLDLHIVDPIRTSV